MERPFTERENQHTMCIDEASAEEIAELLARVDTDELFSDSEDSEVFSLASPAARAQLAELFHAMQRTLQLFREGKRPFVVISGAGTSGRLAFMFARSANRALRETCGFTYDAVHYLIAGGDRALIEAVEGAEDDPIRAAAELAALVDVMRSGGDHACGVRCAELTGRLFIGITCGLSALYVGSQIDAILDSWQAGETTWNFAVLLGFNPPQLARRVPLSSWNGRSFRDVVVRMRESLFASRTIFVCPVTGAEAITGSTRMKAGSATKVILDCVFSAVLETWCDDAAARSRTAGPHSAESDTERGPSDRLAAFLSSCRTSVAAAHAARTGIAALVSAAATARRSGGRVAYVGDAVSGLVGLVDASECVPTFGAQPGDFRAFVAGGWPALLGKELECARTRYPSDEEYYSSLFFIDTQQGAEHFRVLPTDLFIVLERKEGGDAATTALLAAAQRASARVCRVRVSASQCKHEDRVDRDVDVVLPQSSLSGRNCWPILEELAFKVIINVISTGAHIGLGCVFGNRMINVRVTNLKLFDRAVGIVAAVSGANADRARQSLLRAIYGDVDSSSLHDSTGDASVHVTAANAQDWIVPTAVLLCADGALGRDSARALAKSAKSLRLLVRERVSAT